MQFWHHEKLQVHREHIIDFMVKLIVANRFLNSDKSRGKYFFDLLALVTLLGHKTFLAQQCENVRHVILLHEITSSQHMVKDLIYPWVLI